MPAEVTGRGLLRVLEHAPIPVLVGFLAPASAPSSRVRQALHGWASLHAGSLRVLTVDAIRFALTTSALEVSVLPTLQLWSRQRRLWTIEGASDLSSVTRLLGTIADGPPPASRAVAGTVPAPILPTRAVPSPT
jgi:thioredoxin-like negative regulator of GroEL